MSKYGITMTIFTFIHFNFKTGLVCLEIKFQKFKNFKQYPYDAASLKYRNFFKRKYEIKLYIICISLRHQNTFRSSMRHVAVISAIFSTYNVLFTVTAEVCFQIRNTILYTYIF